MFRAQAEIFSSIAENDYNLTNKTTNIELTLPNSLFINGIAIFQEDTSSCKETEIGKVNNLETICRISAYSLC